MKLEFSSQIFIKSSSINFMRLCLWEPSCSVQMDGYTDMTKLLVAFHNFEKAPNKM
jgi:hypothetical protein